MADLNVTHKREFRDRINQVAWYSISASGMSGRFVLPSECYTLLKKIEEDALKLRELIQNIPTLEFKHASTEEVHSRNTSGDVT